MEPLKLLDGHWHSHAPHPLEGRVWAGRGKPPNHIRIRLRLAPNGILVGSPARAWFWARPFGGMWLQMWIQTGISTGGCGEGPGGMCVVWHIDEPQQIGSTVAMPTANCLRPGPPQQKPNVKRRTVVSLEFRMFKKELGIIRGNLFIIYICETIISLSILQLLDLILTKKHYFIL